MKNEWYKIGLVFGIVLLFIGVSVTPVISGKITNLNVEEETKEDSIQITDSSSLTLHTFDKTVENKCNAVLSGDIAYEIHEVLGELRYKIAYEPLSDETKALKIRFVNLLDDNGLIPSGLSKDYILSLLNPFWFNNQEIPEEGVRAPFFSKYLSPIRGFMNKLQQFLKIRYSQPNHGGLNGDIISSLSNAGTGVSAFCSISSAGNGFILPLFYLPRPRAIAMWLSPGGVTLVGELVRTKGFVAQGAQIGLALGFIGIGLTYSLPGYKLYGFIGYALFTSVSAGSIEFFPPNEAPVISDENPVDGTWDVPLSLSELSFRISDPEGKLMSYSVTTDPDIGGGSGILKPDGVYSVSVSGLEGNTEYTWIVEVMDDKNTAVKQFSFYTESVPFDPFDEGWQYRKELTIDHTMVDGDLSSFPVLVSTLDVDLRDKAQYDGDDILFMDGPGVATRLYHEIEYFAGGSGELVAWVNVSSLSSGVDTVLYMYYGNSGSSGQQFPERVWDSDYCAVWHLDDSYDSTINNNHGDVSGSSTSWEIGKCGRGVEITDKGRIEDIPASFDDSISTEFTISCWIKWYGKDPGWPTSSYVFDARSNNYDGGFNLRVLEDGTAQFTQLLGSTYIKLVSASTISKNNWTHVSVVYNSNSQNLRLFINGIEDNSTSISASYYDTYLSPFIGNNLWAPYDGLYRPLNGIVDELQVSKISKSSYWISTEYNNQNDPLSFYNFGPEESAP